MKAGYLVCAESAVVDQSTQNLSIYNIFENLTVPLFPVAVPMSVVAYLVRAPNKRDSQDIRLRFRLDKKNLPTNQAALDSQGKPATRVVARFSLLFYLGRETLPSN